MTSREDKLRLMGFVPYRKKGFTYAKQMPVAFKVRLLNDETIYGADGDFVCTDYETTERWIVAGDIFQNTYDPVPPTIAPADQRNEVLEHHHFGLFRKMALTWAKPITKPMMVHTLEGDVRAQPGEYLCIGAKNEHWPQMKQRFEENYEPVLDKDLAPSKQS